MSSKSMMNDKSSLYLMDTLSSINKDLFLIDEKLDSLMKTDISDQMRVFLADARVAKSNVQQAMLKLVLCFLKTPPFP